MGAYRCNDKNAFGQSVGGDHKCLSGSQDCYRLDVVGSAAYPVNYSTQVYPLFGGIIRFAGEEPRRKFGNRRVGLVGLTASDGIIRIVTVAETQSPS